MYTDIDRVAALERRVAQLEAHFTPSQQQPPAFVLIEAINRNDELVAGTVTFGGAGDTGIGHYEYEWSRPTHWVTDSPWEDEISRLSALAHPQRGEILRRLLGAPATVAELVSEDIVSSTGTAYHHLGALQAAGWVTKHDGGYATLPRPITVGTHSTCDASVSSALHNNAEPGHDDLAAFFLDNGNVRFGGLNADEHTGFEIGSITKTFNAELLRQQIASGDITLETTVGELIDVPGAPIADVNMEELANHTSGLSSVPVELISNRLAMVLSDGNPYREATADEIISYAGDAELKNRGQRNYSNYSHALLGQFLARIANVSYEELLRTSILEPAGMDETYLATSGSGEYSSRGLGLHGRAVEPWDMDGSAPAGAIRSTPADMAKYAQSVADHGRPEYGWARREMGGTEYTFHNGGTGGFRTMLLWSPDGEDAVLVAKSSSMWVDGLAVGLLEELEGTDRR